MKTVHFVDELSDRYDFESITILSIDHLQFNETRHRVQLNFTFNTVDDMHYISGRFDSQQLHLG